MYYKLCQIIIFDNIFSNLGPNHCFYFYDSHSTCTVYYNFVIKLLIIFLCVRLMGITLRHVNILSKNDNDYIPTDIHSSESQIPHSAINRNNKSQILARLLILVDRTI